MDDINQEHATSVSGATSGQSARQESLGHVLQEVIASTRDLVQSEVRLVAAEVKRSAHHAGQHVTQAVIFGALLAISVLPFLAFLVIGLGELLGHRYWLSSLIVAVVCAGIGGTMAYRAFRKIVDVDLDFTASRMGLDLGKDVAHNKMNVLAQAAKGEGYATNSPTHYH